MHPKELFRHIGSVTGSYAILLSVVGFDKQLEITNQTIDIRKKQLETIKALKEGAILTGSRCCSEEANLYAAQVSVPILN